MAQVGSVAHGMLKGAVPTVLKCLFKPVVLGAWQVPCSTDALSSVLFGTLDSLTQ